MHFRKNVTRLAIAASVVGGVGLLSACGGDSDTKYTGEIRVFHASPDAPAVNILLNDSVRVSDLDYAESSGYKRLYTANYKVEVDGIVPGGNQTVISVPALPVTTGLRATVLAVNNVASIEALVVEESASDPEDNEVTAVVVHAAPAAPAVNVYITAPAASIDALTPNIPSGSFAFKDTIDAGALTVGTVEFQVATGTTDGTVVYNSGPVDLTGFAGEELMIIAVATENDTEQDASPVKLIVLAGDAAVELLDADTEAGARVVHLSPDAGDVEVFATPSGGAAVELIDVFSYTDVVPGADSFVGVDATSWVFDVAPNTDSIGDSVYTSGSVALAAGKEYSVIAAGYTATTPAFSLLLTEDDNRAIATEAKVKVIHAAPAAGVVDVFVTVAGDYTVAEIESGATTPLLDDFAYAEITDYVSVAPDDYDIRVVSGGTAIINVENYTLSGGDVQSIIARQPISGGGAPTEAGVVVLTN